MSKYHQAWVEQGKPSYKSIADQFGVNESTARKSIKLHEQRLASRENAETAVLDGMKELGFTGQPSSGWVKSQTPDEHGRTYSFRFTSQEDQKTEEEKLEKIAESFTGIPPILFKPPKKKLISPRKKKAFISINDLHSGSLAWGKETGYGDWNMEIAMERLTEWLTDLLMSVETNNVDEIILFYNGDILHSNGKVPMTATHGSDHILDVSDPFFNMVDTTCENIIYTTDLAAQIADVRLVIKRGNHDGDSYLTLLQGAKWRYQNQPNVTVEMNPKDYWAHIFGKVALFGHHGDRIKPETLIMKFMEEYRDDLCGVRHITLWTGDKHHRKVEQFPGVIWEQASCWTEPDNYGSKWGNQAMAQAVIYDELEGEKCRYTVKASQVFGKD